MGGAEGGGGGFISLIPNIAVKSNIIMIKVKMIFIPIPYPSPMKPPHSGTSEILLVTVDHHVR